MTTNKRLESQLSASEALIHTLKAEADKHRKAYEAMALNALVARSKVLQLHVVGKIKFYI